MASIEKLIAYMEKIGITEDIPKKYNGGCTYKVEKWGSHYFKNIQISKSGCIVSFDYESIGYMLCKQKEKMLKKYCSRYGYKVFYESGYPGCFFLWVMPEKDLDELNDIWTFENNCKSECELLIHKYHESGRYNSDHARLENELKAIMSEYESSYFEFLKSCNIVQFSA